MFLAFVESEQGLLQRAAWGQTLQKPSQKRMVLYFNDERKTARLEAVQQFVGGNRHFSYKDEINGQIMAIRL